MKKSSSVEFLKTITLQLFPSHLVLTPKPGFPLRSHRKMYERCHSDEAFLLRLSSSVHWWVCCVAVACDQILCIIAETKKNVQVLWSRRSVARVFLVSKCGRQDKGDRLGLPPNQSWHFSLHSRFSTISFVLFLYPLPHTPSCALQCNRYLYFTG